MSLKLFESCPNAPSFMTFDLTEGQETGKGVRRAVYVTGSEVTETDFSLISEIVAGRSIRS